MLVAANFLLLGSLVSKVQRVSRVWVVDNSSLAGYTYAVVVPFVLAAADAGLFVLVFLFVHRWYKYAP